MSKVKVLICSYLEPEHVARIRALDERLELCYAPELLPEPRYAADHIGAPLVRSAEAAARWAGYLREAEVLFDFDYTDIASLPERAPCVRWVQASSAGIGQFVRRYDLGRMNAVFTTASGVHARPLAEFVLMVMLERVKRVELARHQQRQHLWQRFATGELSRQTLAIVGYGRIGAEVARLAKAFEMRVVASKRSPAGLAASEFGLDALYGPGDLYAMLGEADFACLVTPHTPETEGLMGVRAFAALKPGATLINIARGAVVDEAAMLAALERGQLGHAALDVAATEPLPPESPLWDHPRVTIYPHSASTSARENERLTDLFCDNLRRYLAGEPLLNRLDLERMY